MWAHNNERWDYNLQDAYTTIMCECVWVPLFHSILCTHLPFFTSDIPSVYEPEILIRYLELLSCVPHTRPHTHPPPAFNMLRHLVVNVGHGSIWSSMSAHWRATSQSSPRTVNYWVSIMSRTAFWGTPEMVAALTQLLAGLTQINFNMLVHGLQRLYLVHVHTLCMILTTMLL